MLGTVRSSQVVAPEGAREQKTGDRAAFGEQGAGAGSGVEVTGPSSRTGGSGSVCNVKIHPTGMWIIIVLDPRDGIEHQQGLQGSDHGKTQFQISGTRLRKRGSPKVYCAQ